MSHGVRFAGKRSKIPILWSLVAFATGPTGHRWKTLTTYFSWEKDRYTFLSQYQQNPMALTGGIIDTSWFRTYTTLPKLTHRAVYVDTNSGKVDDWLDYTVFTLAGMGVDGNLYIIDVVRGRWDPEDLLKKAEEVWEKWRLSGSMRVMPLRHMGH